ncbi:hypothetical protein HIM_11808 [Hirsutella minnesotensis 3608]|uniref:SHSP domain-containing protein n=1 Tax=Hirsutella minnesotensis 3608 TaxID=1043627 RepID=A0A0F8A0S3_9HYPO|nr:hypothetical protein HIM_11808 [Hirsutella minnesotensis 3608]
MAFFPRNFYQGPSDSSFTPLFRLLSDFDNYSRQVSGGQQQQQQHQGRRHGSLPSWQPKFDVRETDSDYELHGELPGMSKEHVHVEFTDPQTMLVRGRVERNYSAGTPPAGHIEDSHEARGAIAEGDAAAEEHRSRSPHRATVEDDDTEGAVATTKAEQQQQQHKKPADTAKYWISERSVGEFARSFNFPSRIDQDGVSASFKDGILSIVVPKAKKHESRRIAIN